MYFFTSKLESGALFKIRQMIEVDRSSTVDQAFSSQGQCSNCHIFPRFVRPVVKQKAPSDIGYTNAKFGITEEGI